MTGVVGCEGKGSCAVQVVVGVDTHQDNHVAVAIDRQVFVSVSVTRQQPRSGTVSSNGGPGAWERFARSGLKAPVPMVPESPAS